MYNFGQGKQGESYVESRLSAYRIDCINAEANTISSLLVNLNKELDKDLSTLSNALTSLNFTLERLSIKSLDADLLKTLGILHSQLNFRLGNFNDNPGEDVFSEPSIYAGFIINKLSTLKSNLKTYRSKLIERDIKRIHEEYLYPSVSNAEKCLKSVYSLHIAIKGLHVESIDEELITKLIGVEGVILNHNDYLLRHKTQEAQVLFDHLEKYRADLWSITHNLILNKVKAEALFVSDEHANALSFIKNFNTLSKKDFAVQFTGCMQLLVDQKLSLPEIRIFRILLRGFAANRFDYGQNVQLEEIFGDSIIFSKLGSNGNGQKPILEFPQKVDDKYKFDLSLAQMLGPDESYLMGILGISSTEAVKLLKQDRFPTLEFGPIDKSKGDKCVQRLIASDFI